MQKLPIGIQSFADLRSNEYIYVDKTRLIYELSNVARFVFLARPRRFGKSLLTTTLQEIYRGNKDRKSTRLNSSHVKRYRMPSSA